MSILSTCKTVVRIIPGCISRSQNVLALTSANTNCKTHDNLAFNKTLQNLQKLAAYICMHGVRLVCLLGTAYSCPAIFQVAIIIDADLRTQ
jgi:hypothetical protein